MESFRSRLLVIVLAMASLATLGAKGGGSGGVKTPPPPIARTAVCAYNSQTYYLVDVPQTWDTARKVAGQYGGHLAVVTSAEENTCVRGLLGYASSISGWLGGSDAARRDDGKWTWRFGPESDVQFWQGLSGDLGGYPVGGQFTAWLTGEPNSYQGADEDCLAMYRRDATWNDQTCTRTLPYIIEVPQS